jgi:hypothetical protein
MVAADPVQEEPLFLQRTREMVHSDVCFSRTRLPPCRNLPFPN